MKHDSLQQIYRTYKAIWLKTLQLAYAHDSHAEQQRTPKENKSKHKKKGKRLVHSRQICVDEELLDAIHQFIQRPSSDNQPIYSSVASFVRDALAEYQQGLDMAPDTQADRKITTLRLDNDLNAFWSSLPRGKRSDILEVILRFKLGDIGSV